MEHVMATGKNRRILVLSFIALAALSEPGVTAIRVQPVSFQCTAIGMGDIILMRMRFESLKGMPRLLEAVFQGKQAYGRGRRMTFEAAGMEIGTIKLKPVLGGDVAGVLLLSYAPA